jgi:hypothetical protein
MPEERPKQGLFWQLLYGRAGFAVTNRSILGIGRAAFSDHGLHPILEVPMIQRFRSMQLLVAPIIIAACSGSTQPDLRKVNPSLVRVADCSGPARSLDASLVSTLPPRSGNMNPDDRWADLAEQVPGGFAGVLYVDNKPVLMLTDPSQASAAKKALASQLAGFNVAGAEVRKARWDFAQLVNWYDYLTIKTSVWQTPGMVSGDKDEAINRIHFGVVDSAARDALLHTLAGINLPCDLIAVEITGAVVANSR